ncbi:MAG: putative Ig domain-containing protein, partial [Myxococcota bacterium]
MTFKSSGLRLALVVFAGAGLQLGCGGSDKTEVVPQPPKLEAINPVTVKEGTPLTIAVKATDVDSPADSLTFLLENAPTGMTMAGSTLSWTPGYDQAGSHTVGVTVKDDTGLTAKIDIAITVENVNRAPTIDLPPTLNGKAGEALTIAVTASDPDGDTVTITWDTMPPGAFWDSATNTVSWTPGFNQVGSHQIVFTATDNGNPALMTSLRVVISVQATNRAPVLEPIGGKEVDATSLLTFVVRANDPDLDAVTLAATGLPTGASFDPATGVFNWRPTLADVGTVTVNFTATDAGGLVDSEAVTIVVNTKNLAPVLADPGPKTVAEGAALAFTLAATDPNTADTLIYSYSPALPGAVLNPTTGAFSWTPGFSAAGSYSVTFTATDNGTPPLSASRTVTLTVTDANRAPTVSFIGNQTVAQGETLSFIVSATDPDGDTLTLSSSTLPTNATFSTSSGAFSFSPSFSQTGTETITFTATDPGGLTGSQTVQIAINSTNRKPVLANVAAQTVAEGAQLNITLSATDPDGDTLTYSFSGSLPTGATFDPATRRFSWTPGYSQAGTYSVTFVATDNGVPALSDSKSANITVTNTNRAPEFVAVGPQTVKITENLTFTLNVSDPDGDSVTVAAGTLPTNATFDAASRRFSFNPVLGQEGSYTVNFTATDSG